MCTHLAAGRERVTAAVLCTTVRQCQSRPALFRDHMKRFPNVTIQFESGISGLIAASLCVAVEVRIGGCDRGVGGPLQLQQQAYAVP